MFEELRQIIEKYDSIVIFGHPYPDGDCYGSQIGLRDALRLNYPKKQVYAVGSGIHRFFKLISPMDNINDDVIKQSLAILVDGNDFERMEDQRVSTAQAWIKIDHHMDNFKYTQGPSVLNTEANSTCELVVQMIKECDWKVNPTICNALFLGILTDTGRFQFVEDFPLCFQEAAWLCENGADPEAINAILNVTNEAALRFKGYVFSHYKKTRNGVIYVTFTKEKLHELRTSANKAGSMVNLLSNVKGYPIWAFFCENDDGTAHSEFRSNGPGVQPVAAKHGGGGHYHAAGVTTPDLSKETLKSLLKDLDKSIKEYRKEHK